MNGGESDRSLVLCEAVAPSTWGRERQGCVACKGNMGWIRNAGTTHANLTAGNSKSGNAPCADASSPEEPGAGILHAGICGGGPSGDRRSYLDLQLLRVQYYELSA